MLSSAYVSPFHTIPAENSASGGIVTALLSVTPVSFFYYSIILAKLRRKRNYTSFCWMHLVLFSETLNLSYVKNVSTYILAGF